MTTTKVFYPQGVCSQLYQITLTDGKIEEIQILGGCNGNLKGISSLLRGMTAEYAIARMEGITCGSKGTSCPDQIAKALKQML